LAADQRQRIGESACQKKRAQRKGGQAEAVPDRATPQEAWLRLAEEWLKMASSIDARRRYGRLGWRSLAALMAPSYRPNGSFPWPSCPFEDAEKHSAPEHPGLKIGCVLLPSARVLNTKARIAALPFLRVVRGRPPSSWASNSLANAGLKEKEK
jgi:hypothetical protein